MSLAGAQHKLPVVRVGGELHEPVEATPSTHILNPDHPVAAEYPAFNVVVANDCHLKNLSFFIDPAGVHLAPHYDLLATSVWNTRAFADQATWPNGPMAIALPGATRFGQVTTQAVMEAGLALGVPGSTAQRILREIVTRLPRALEQEAAALQQRHAAAPDGARSFLAAEARAVRVLHQLVVPEMLQRLATP